MSGERKALGSSTMSSANQITLPKKVREKMNMEVGDVVVFYEEPDGKITVQR
ncbi:MAG: AbrB/MazE/SpoVT family DNA-binding domain-containing protein [Candidatus Odinarchaeota archaeon]